MALRPVGARGAQCPEDPNSPIYSRTVKYRKLLRGMENFPFSFELGPNPPCIVTSPAAPAALAWLSSPQKSSVPAWPGP